MMRYILLGLLILLLAACGGNGDDSAGEEEAATQPPSAVIGAPDEAALEALIQEAAGMAEPVPTPEAIVTEEPAPDQRFDWITFRWTGGIDDLDITLAVYSDGRIVRGGVESRISDEQIERLHDLLLQTDFFSFGLQAAFIPPRPERYSYEISVQRGDSVAEVQFTDDRIPQALRPLLAALVDLSG
ncbi:MAG: hypothetical protein EA396_06700 [Anaerolineaceae bacterium]|nr:MAG: hypothetical protein EA396_06700 [Anaerolineaceae bacterium]